MSEFRIVNAHLTLDAAPELFRYVFTLPDGSAWSMTKRPFIRFSDGSELSFPARRPPKRTGPAPLTASNACTPA